MTTNLTAMTTSDTLALLDSEPLDGRNPTLARFIDEAFAAGGTLCNLGWNTRGTQEWEDIKTAANATAHLAAIEPIKEATMTDHTTRDIVKEYCEEIIETGQGTTIMFLTGAYVATHTAEYSQAFSFISKFESVEEYNNIRFMLACFTLLLEGDDNF